MGDIRWKLTDGKIHNTGMNSQFLAATQIIQKPLGAVDFRKNRKITNPLKLTIIIDLLDVRC